MITCLVTVFRCEQFPSRMQHISASWVIFKILGCDGNYMWIVLIHIFIKDSNSRVFHVIFLRHLEKLSDLFEKLRVSIYQQTETTFIYSSWLLNTHWYSFCSSAESGGKSSIWPGAETHRVAKILHERHPGCQSESCLSFAFIQEEKQIHSYVSWWYNPHTAVSQTICATFPN